ncbi:tyrosine-type recombinase/integrase [Aquimarina celericrescens]|uniref:Tyrosine-type recombinase/integrase n=1 Tax=Aquimarina celericrescens TaxID=1964542 RepID=A0ABW5AW78_9FLAO|nr:site-specific integrase [Aquimarina celericrescens]
MAKIFFFLDTRNKKSDTFPLVQRVSHQRKRKDIKTPYIVSPNLWNEKGRKFKSSFPNSVRANAFLTDRMKAADDVLLECESFLKSMSVEQLASLIEDKIEEYANDKIDKKVKHKINNITRLQEYGKIVTKRYREAKRFGMADAIEDAIRMVVTFNGGEDPLITEIDETFLENLEAYYLNKGNSLNGLGVRLRSIRRVFNLVIKDGNTELKQEHYPFGKNGYSIKQQHTKKRAVGLDVIEKIKELDYPEGSSLWHHKNYFLFNFYMRGMNFMDIAYLKVGAIKKGRLQYKRRKTKRGNNVREFDILIPNEINKMLKFYTAEKSKEDLVFPILQDVIHTESEERIHELYSSRLRNHNRRLKTISKELELDTKLTTYVARHTFATAGIRKGVSKAQVGDMLGHTNYYTTEAYFADFENAVLDEAADKIFN